jgi:hypothetical protein
MATMHDSPAQQSALMVQPPHTGTHAAVLQMKDDPASPGFGTQGTPPQQSALDAQA